MKTVLAALALLLLSSLSSAAALPVWDKLPPTSRELVVQQYVSGYIAGASAGISEGIQSAVSYMRTTGGNLYIDNKPNDHTACSQLIQSNIDRIYDESKGWQQLQNKGAAFYVSEINQLVKKYPLCGKTDLAALIENLTPIWLNLNTRTTADDIGAACGK